jgi:hypothetical protein
MNTVQKLGGLLAVQIALGAFTWWPRDAATATPKLLVEGGGNTITKVTIVNNTKDAKPVELESKDGKWTLVSASGFPADADKIGEVLDALAAIKLADPIASQASSFEQLKVSDTTYDKKVVFTASGAEHTLLVGAAASKSIYLRVDGGADVYQAKGLSAWTFKDSTRGFLPANAIEIDREKLTSLTLTNASGTIALVKQGEAWALGGDAPGPANADKVSDLLDKATKVRLADVAGAEVKPEYGLSTPAATVSWTLTDGGNTSTGSYTVGASADGTYFVQQAGDAFVFESPNYRMDDLVKSVATELVGDASAAPGLGQDMQPGFDPSAAMQPH